MSYAAVVQTGGSRQVIHPSGWGPIVRGVCPACGWRGLFLGENGYVTCASLSCSDPCAASDVLNPDGYPETPRD